MGGRKGGAPPLPPSPTTLRPAGPSPWFWGVFCLSATKATCFPPSPPPQLAHLQASRPSFWSVFYPSAFFYLAFYFLRVSAGGGGRREGPHNPCCPVVPFSTLLMRAPHSLQGGSGNEGLLASIRDLLWIPITQSAYRCEV